VLDRIKAELETIRGKQKVSALTRRQAQALYLGGQCQMLSCSRESFHLVIDDEFKDFEVWIEAGTERLAARCSCKATETPCHHTLAGLFEVADYLQRQEHSSADSGKVYTREGMIRRVLAERREKAERAGYQLAFADNPHGEHQLINERGLCYKLTFRDIEQERGYCSCPDYRTNKLGTCKHLMYAFARFKQEYPSAPAIGPDYPFIEVFLDPLDPERILWFYPQPLPEGLQALFEQFFSSERVLRPEKKSDFLSFCAQAEAWKEVLIRPEVLESVEEFCEEKLLEQLRTEQQIDYSGIKAKLFPYQREGIAFAAFRKGAMLADEMGLGKTLQAIGVATVKQQLFGFERTLVVCPASLKEQWKREIERFSDHRAVVVEGNPAQRTELYRNCDAYFLICNYEAVLRDIEQLCEFAPDFIILDEAQRIKNYETRTAACIKRIPKRHALVLTGTPIENRLVDLYSIVDFLNPRLLAPLWEFSYQYCCFDSRQKNKITGYYNLQALKKRLRPILLRREKADVLKQLPQVSQLDIPVELHPRQAEYHANYARSLARILRKKFLTPFDLRKMQLLLAKMRMVCDSTLLVDPEQEIHYAPKLDELRHILVDKFNLRNTKRKVVIFSEWVRMNQQIARMLRENDIGFIELNGKVPVSKRAALIREFEQNDTCQVFLSTEAGGAGLNLQVADTVVNFELPWNPARKNQRIGRIDRLGQRSRHLTVINLIAKNSIETRIADGLLLKQDLFAGVLSPGSRLDRVDFSDRGRAQFLRQLEAAIEPLCHVEEEETPPLPATATATKEEVADPLAEPEESFSEEEQKQATRKASSSPSPAPRPSAEQLSQVMQQGMAFLSGLMQMATGQPLPEEGGHVEVDPESGEVVLRFRVPLDNPKQ